MLNFPDTPAVNSVFSAAATSWLWDSTKWKANTSGGWVPPLTMSGSGNLPLGYSGVVTVRNSSGAPITIGLPPSPAPGQSVLFKDAIGTTAAHPVTIVTVDGSTIDSYASTMLVSDYMSLEVFWMGDQWGTK